MTDGKLTRLLVPETPSEIRLAVIVLVLAAWIAALVGLYFATVWPLRHQTRTQTTTMQANGIQSGNGAKGDLALLATRTWGDRNISWLIQLTKEI